VKIARFPLGQIVARAGSQGPLCDPNLPPRNSECLPHGAREASAVRLSSSGVSRTLARYGILGARSCLVAQRLPIPGENIAQVHPSEARTPLPELQQYNSFSSHYLPSNTSTSPLSPCYISKQEEQMLEPVLAGSGPLPVKPIRDLPNEPIYTLNGHKIRRLPHWLRTRLAAGSRGSQLPYAKALIYT
jgi:hypothetical protein